MKTYSCFYQHYPQFFFFIKKIFSLTLFGFILAGCGGGNSEHGEENGFVNEEGNSNQLIIIAPKNMQAQPATSYSYVWVINDGEKAVHNIIYQLGDRIGSGEHAKIDEPSAKSCSTLSANSKCIIKIQIPPTLISGSFSIYAYNDNHEDATPGYSILQKPFIGIEQAKYSTSPDASGITLYYYRTVTTKVPYVRVNGLVASGNVGDINNVVLVDSKGNPIPDQELLSGNLGAHISKLGKGTTFSYVIPTPASSGLSQTIKAQVNKSLPDGSTSRLKNGIGSSTILTSDNVGIVSSLQNAIFLTNKNPSQTISFYNNGDSKAILKKVFSANKNLVLSFNPQELNSGERAIATVSLKDKNIHATTSSVELSYINGKNDITQDILVYQNIDPYSADGTTPSVIAPPIENPVIPEPTPNPEPIPSPEPGREAKPGLAAAFTSNNNFFTTTKIGKVSRQLTITNTGNVPDKQINIDLPDGFSIENGSTNSCEVVNTANPATINNILESESGSCNLIVNYQNNLKTAQKKTKLKINYMYDNAQTAPAPVSVDVNYRVSQSTANLYLKPAESKYFGSIINDNNQVSTTESFTLVNTGDEAASNLNFKFSEFSLFKIVAGSCVNQKTLSADSGKNSCTISVRFGPTSHGSNGLKSETFSVSYNPYPNGGTVNSNHITLSGMVTQASMAEISRSIFGKSGFLSGMGSRESSFVGHINTNNYVNIKYVNNSTKTAANNFSTKEPESNGAWILSTHGCNNVNLSANGGNCTDTFKLNSRIQGSHDLILGKAGWGDSSDNHQNQAISGISTIYASLYPGLVIEVPPIPNGGVSAGTSNKAVMMGTGFQFKVLIQSGIGNSTVSATVPDASKAVITPATCTLDKSENKNSCTFTLLTKWDTSLPNGVSNLEYSFNLSATNGATLSRTKITYREKTPAVYLLSDQYSVIENDPGNIGIPYFENRRFIIPNDKYGRSCTAARYDTATGLMWLTDANIFNSKSFSNAGEAVAAVNQKLNSPSAVASNVYCGYDDWRVPTANEMLSLVNYKAVLSSHWLQEVIRPYKFENVKVNPSYLYRVYWTSTLPRKGNYLVDLEGAELWSFFTPSSAIEQAVWPVRGN